VPKDIIVVGTSAGGIDASRLLVDFLSIQNLTNNRYEIARSPVLNVGPPLLAGGRAHSSALATN
jgi:hypothetical protein